MRKYRNPQKQDEINRNRKHRGPKNHHITTWQPTKIMHSVAFWITLWFSPTEYSGYVSALSSGDVVGKKLEVQMYW